MPEVTAEPRVFDVFEIRLPADHGHRDDDRWNQQDRERRCYLVLLYEDEEREGHTDVGQQLERMPLVIEPPLAKFHAHCPGSIDVVIV